MQGRVQGFNYMIMTASWAIGPYAYWYMYVVYVTDDDDKTHTHDTQSGLFWWVTLGILAAAALVMMIHVGVSEGSKLLKGAGRRNSGSTGANAAHASTELATE